MIHFIKIAFRVLNRNKAYSILNIFGLSLGITGGILIFLIVKFHLSTDRHHSNFDNIYRTVVDLHLEDGSIEHERGSTYLLHETLKKDYPFVKKAAYIANTEITIAVSKKKDVVDRYLEKTGASYINSDYFDIFDYQWIIGSPALMKEPNTVVLTEKWAKKYFGNETPVGKTIKANNLVELKVAGLVKDHPTNTDFNTELFISLPSFKSIQPTYGRDGFYNWGWIDGGKSTYVLLNEGTKRAQFDKQMPAFAKKYYGDDGKYYHYHLQELSDSHFNMDYGGKIRKSTIWTLIFIGLFLVATACINFVNLATAQALKRSKEVGVRKALGGTKTQLFWQFIIETSCITICAVVVALFFSYALLPSLNNWIKTPLSIDLLNDFQLFAFICLLATLVVFVAGFYPSLILSGFNPIEALKRKFTAHQVGGFSLRKGLVIVQFSISQILIIATLVIMSQLSYFKNKDIGIDKDLVVHINVPKSPKTTMDALRYKLLQSPAIQNASFFSTAPSSQSGSGGSIQYDNREWEKFVARSKIADSYYIDNYGIKLVAGRNIAESDTVQEALINLELAKKLGLKNPAEALNKKLFIGDADRLSTIVGVVKDFNNREMYFAIEPTVIFSSAFRYRTLGIKLKTTDTQAALESIKKEWQAFYPTDVFEFKYYDEEIAHFYEKENLFAKLVNIFALVAIFIGCLGLYGLISFMANQKTKEIGIRKILGANIAEIILMFGKEFAQMIAIAFLIATPIAWYTMHQWLKDFAYRITIEWWIFALAGASAIIIALLTISHQAIQAATRNPIESLKNE